MHRVDAFGNSPGVCQKLAEGIGSLPGWRKGVRQKKTEIRRKIIGGSRKACRDSNDAVGSRQKFASRFAEGIGKLARNAKADRQKEDRRTCSKIAGGCRSIQDERWLDRPYHRIRATGDSFRRVNHPGGG
ncbi:hypothetical protein BHE74_00051534 [Ensete ventricosum]|nr:hypothetical protein BHE74_00051534 [Ensete ventricosum]